MIFASMQVSAIGSLGKYIITQNIICLSIYFISKINLFINDEHLHGVPKSLTVLSTESVLHKVNVDLGLRLSTDPRYYCFCLSTEPKRFR